MKKRLPSLSSNFPTIINDGGFYVDKTRFIEKMESYNFKYLVLLRPRRFGKSLFISMLEHYYGVQHRANFDSLFGEYYIGQPGNETVLKNSYFILKFNFSGIETSDPELIRPAFIRSLIGGMTQFSQDYGFLNNEDIKELSLSVTASGAIGDFFNKLQQNGFKSKIYLLIDEYDHFTNELFSFNRNHFSEIVSRNGWVRKFYEVIKQQMGEGVIDRFFATGVTPVTLDSMTSGFNVAVNISGDEDFHEIAGFSENELRTIITHTIYDESKFDIEMLIQEMRLWYNGSKFARYGKEKLYNPQMVVSFLSGFSKAYRFPEVMADINVTSDYIKISKILGYLTKAESERIISDILNKESISETLTIQFNFELPFTRVEAISLLFYNGLLTIENAEFSLYNFVIPNYVIKQMYWEYFRYIYTSENELGYDNTPINQAIVQMSREGKIDNLVTYVQNVMKGMSYRDIENFSEKNLKMIFMTMLMGTNAYFIKSETETNSGYVDLLFKRTAINPGKDDFLLELKYVKNRDKKNFELLKQAGIEQAKKYLNSLNSEESANYKAFVVLFHDKYEFDLIPLQ